MIESEEEKLNRQFDHIEEQLPDRVSRAIRWLREPSSRWVRIPVGVLLIIGGIVGVLPFFGIWMLPIGLLLLAQDVPFLRRPMRKALAWTERQWMRWKRWRRDRRA